MSDLFITVERSGTRVEIAGFDLYRDPARRGDGDLIVGTVEIHTLNSPLDLLDTTVVLGDYRLVVRNVSYRSGFGDATLTVEQTVEQT